VELPGRVALGGADWFLYVMDLGMRRRTGAGCVCHLVAEVAVDVDAVRACARAAPRWMWMVRLRLRAAPPVVRPCWETSGEASDGVVDLGGLADDAALLAALPSRLDVEVAPAVRLSWARLGAEGRSVVVLTWHHGLLDARAAERLLAEVGGHPAVMPDLPAPAEGLWARIWRAKQARDFIHGVSTGPVAWLHERSSGGAHRFLRLRFGPDDVARIDRRAEQVGAALLRSALHVGAATRAVAAVLQQRGVQTGDLLVPAPQDQRRGRGPVGNGLSLLFYRVPRDVAADLPALVRHAIEQARGMLRSGMPGAMTTLLDLCCWLPAWMYGPIVRLPTRGRVATLGVSDTGDSLGQLVALFGASVTDAWHVPANLHPPGVTFVFTRFRGSIDAVLRWHSDVLDDGEVALLVEHLKGDLLG
jgi:hypothetical protein